MPLIQDDSHMYHKRNNIQISSSDISRTQYKLQLQRLSFLTNDKNYLDHPQNMRRLTKELDRVEREYKNVRRYEDPLKQSFERLLKHRKSSPVMTIPTKNSGSSESGSSYGSSYSSSAEKFGFLSRWFTTQDYDQHVTNHTPDY